MSKLDLQHQRLLLFAISLCFSVHRCMLADTADRECCNSGLKTLMQVVSVKETALSREHMEPYFNMQLCNRRPTLSSVNYTGFYHSRNLVSTKVTSLGCIFWLHLRDAWCNNHWDPTHSIPFPSQVSVTWAWHHNRWSHWDYFSLHDLHWWFCSSSVTEIGGHTMQHKGTVKHRDTSCV